MISEERETMLDKEKEYKLFDASHCQIQRWVKQDLEKGENPLEAIAKLSCISAALMFKTMSL